MILAIANISKIFFMCVCVEVLGLWSMIVKIYIVIFWDVAV